MNESERDRELDVAFISVMAAMAFFSGFAPLLMQYFAAAVKSMPRFAFVCLMTIPLQLAYLAAAILPFWNWRTRRPPFEKLDFTFAPGAAKKILCAVVFTGALTPLLALVTFGMRELMPLLGMKPVRQELVELMAKSSWSVVALIAVVSVFLAPLCEEYVFRFVIFRKFRRISPPWGAAAVAAFLFSLSHMNPMIAPALFLLGLYLQYLYARTNSMLYPVIGHAAFNLFSTLFVIGSRLFG